MRKPSLRKKFIAAAVNRFNDSGFRACTIEDIAKEAGAFKGSFYNHFDSKEAIAVVTVEIYTEVGLSMLAMEGPPSPLKRLRQHFEQIAAHQKKHHRLQGCLLANFSAEITNETGELRKALNEAIQRWGKAIAEVIRQGQKSGEISKRHHPDQLARYLLNAWEGAAVRVRATQSFAPLDDFFRISFEQLLA